MKIIQSTHQTQMMITLALLEIYLYYKTILIVTYLKTDNKYTTRIIDHGTGLILTNNINQLNQLNNIQNSNDKINCSGTYYGNFKNNKIQIIKCTLCIKH